MNSATADREFTKSFLISCGVHVLLALMAYFAGASIAKIFNSNENVEIIHSAVRVDVVGMPKFTVKELKVMQAEPVAKPEPEPEGAKVETKKEEAPDVIKKDDIVVQEKATAPVVAKPKTNFLSMINDYSSKKVAPSERKKGVKASSNKNLDSLIIEGNRLSKGGALVGEYSDADSSELAQYVQSLPELVRVHFKLPSYLKEQDLRCRIAVYINAEGAVLRTALLDSSGNGEFDARAEKAIRDAAPLPKPPATTAPRLVNSGIILRFPL